MAELTPPALRSCAGESELEAALAESKADLDAGRFVKESVEQHIKRLAERLPWEPDNQEQHARVMELVQRLEPYTSTPIAANRS